MKNRHALFLSHGGGPLPLLGDEGHKEMVENLKTLAAGTDQPSAILLVSAHWEENRPTVTAGASPSLIYDYYGFPEESYRIKYPCPGEPSLARQIEELFTKAGTEIRSDKQRGFDHGLFVPLKIMYPKADIPCVQLSLLKSLDPAEHIKMGMALSALDYEGLLVIGSGFSFHNMRAFFQPDTPETKAMNEKFEEWLIDSCSNPELSEEERARRLTHWEQAPHARYCHPREEHLLPLHVCYGFTQSACSRFFELRILNKKSSLYLW